MKDLDTLLGEYRREVEAYNEASASVKAAATSYSLKKWREQRKLQAACRRSMTAAWNAYAAAAVSCHFPAQAGDHV